MKRLLCLLFLVNATILTAQLELRRSDDFGINIETKCNPDGPGYAYIDVLAANDKSLSFYSVLDENCGHLVNGTLYMAFLPAPWETEMENRLNDSIVHTIKAKFEDKTS